MASEESKLPCPSDFDGTITQFLAFSITTGPTSSKSFINVSFTCTSNLLFFPFFLLDHLQCHSTTSMVSLYFHFIFVVLVVFAVVDAQHIRKLHRSPDRTRCRPRPTSSSRAVSISSNTHAPAREVLNGTLSDYHLFSTASTTLTVLRRSTNIFNGHSSKAVSTNQRSTLTPNNVKAGIAGGDAYPFLKDHIGWWYDWCASVFFVSIYLKCQL